MKPRLNLIKLAGGLMSRFFSCSGLISCYRIFYKIKHGGPHNRRLKAPVGAELTHICESDVSFSKQFFGHAITYEI